jgi:hypothetical protein
MMEEKESLEEEINDLLLKLVELKIEKKKVRSDLIIKTNKLQSTIAATESNFRVGQLVKYCSNSKNRNFDEIGKIASVTSKCVWIESKKKGAKCTMQVLRNKKNVYSSCY